MSEENRCRLCLNICLEQKQLYDEHGERNLEIFNKMCCFFNPKFLKTLMTICLPCWQRINNFHNLLLLRTNNLTGNSYHMTPFNQAAAVPAENYDEPAQSNDGSLKTTIKDEISLEEISFTNVLSFTTQAKKKNRTTDELDEIISKWRTNLECGICQKPHEDYELLAKHFRLEHVPEKPYILCCQLKIQTRGHVADHACYHMDPEFFKCPRCGRCLSSRNTLRSHLECHNAEHTTLNRYLTETKNIETTRCNFIEIINNWRSNLECSICLKSYKNFSLLSQHFGLEHTSEVAHVLCCQRRFMTLREIADHAGMHLNEKTTTTIVGSKNQEAAIKQKAVKDLNMLEAEEQNTDQDVLLPKSEMSRMISIKKIQRTPMQLDQLNLECGICQSPQSDFAFLVKHFSLKHASKKAHILCCDLKLLSRDKIADHAAYHKNPEIYKCSECDKRHTSRNQLRLHKYYHQRKRLSEKEDPASSFKSEGASFDDISMATSKYKLSTKSQLDKTISKWRPTLECAICQSLQANFELLIKHFSLKHAFEKAHIRCCDLKLTSRHKIAEHAGYHKNPEIYKCSECDKCNTSRNQLRLHKYYHLRKRLAEKEDPASSFTKEGASFSDMSMATSKYKLRTRSQLDKTISKWRANLECGICQSLQANFELLVKHFSLKHTSEKAHILCCDHKFMSRNKIADHAGYHKNPEIFKCSECGKCNISRHSLRMHMDYHRKKQNLISRRLEERKTKSSFNETIASFIATIAKWRSYLKCSICQKPYKDFLLLSRHFSIDHPAERAHILCCERRLLTLREIAKHASVHMNETSVLFGGGGEGDEGGEDVKMAGRNREANQQQHQQDHHQSQGNKQIQKPQQNQQDQKLQPNQQDQKPQRNKQTQQPQRNEQTQQPHRNKQDQQPVQHQQGQQLQQPQQDHHQPQRNKQIQQPQPNQQDQQPEQHQQDQKPQRNQQLEQDQQDQNKFANVTNETIAEYAVDELSDSKSQVTTSALKTRSTATVTKLRSAEEMNDIISKWRDHIECGICHEPLANFQLLQEHFCLEHPLEKPHMLCCRLKLSNRADIADHASYHIDPEFFKCSECGKCFASRSAFSNHKYAYHSRGKSNLKQARESTEHKTTGNLLSVKDSNDIISKWRQNLECVICQKSHADFATLSQHFSLKHPSEQAYILCCKLKLMTLKEIVDHASLHMDPETFKCLECDKSHTDLDSLCQHLSCEHSTKLGTGKYVCKVCNKISTTPLYLKEHQVANHTKATLYSCSACPLTFVYSASLAKHLKNQHPQIWSDNKVKTTVDARECDAIILKWKSNLECGSCQKSHVNFKALNSHFKLEHPNQKTHILCCGYKHMTRLLIADHANLHMDPEFFKCHQCDKCHKSKQELTLHMRRKHSSEEASGSKFTCTICNRAYASAFNLKEHMDYHKAAGRFKCLLCSRMYRRPSEIKRHLKSKHVQQWSESKNIESLYEKLMDLPG